jgi:hypothetical protein
MSVPQGARRPWLVGPLPDLLLGCGLGYLLLVGVLAIARPDMSRLQPWLPLLILATGVPHYGATLVRAYGDAASRRRYALFGVYLSALVWGAFAWAAFEPRLGSLLITLYLSWSPWHYAGQNYGLVLMFLGRGGTRLEAPARRLLRATFGLSVAMTLLNFHRVLGVGSSDPMFDAGGAYHFVPLGIPEAIARLLFPLLAAAYLVCLAALVWNLRGVSRRALLPAAALVLSQALWFAVPAGVAHLARPGLIESLGAPVAFLWIAVAHSVQYLWISRHFARSSGGGEAGAFWGGRVLLAGAAIWVLPALAFAPGALGRVPFEAGLGLLVAAAVNLHHFVLDGAIWKLRDPGVGQVLLAGEAAPASAPEGPRPPPALVTGALVTAGLFSVACWIGITWEKEVGHRRALATSDLPRARLAAERLRFLGRDGPRLRNALGRLEERRGQPEAAAAEYRRSLLLAPSAAAWAGLGRIADARGDLPAAREAYREALALDPQREAIRRRLDQLRVLTSESRSARR